MFSRAFLLSCVAVILSACTGQAIVPPVTVQLPDGMVPVRGHYAAMVQTGGWALKAKSQGSTCTVWSFDADLNNAYQTAMRDMLTQAVEKVTFVPDTIPGSELAHRGYDAQIVVYQGNAESKFNVAQKFFGATAFADVALTSVIAVTDTTGLSAQYTITGKGSGMTDVFVCDKSKEAITGAAQAAIQDTTRNAALYIRDGLRSRMEKAAPQTGRPKK
ncbi:MAG: hypothetical protein WBK91_03975 [Alphaproteobacteria bacterium]